MMYDISAYDLMVWHKYVKGENVIGIDKNAVQKTYSLYVFYMHEL